MLEAYGYDPQDGASLILMQILPQALQLSTEFWNTAAGRYERVFTGTSVGKMWRDSVWRELDSRFESGARVLELNCGTGIDAIHLAQRGVSVLACDISPRMIELARMEASATPVFNRIDFRVLATEHLTALGTSESFDGAFSNFSGLNCVQDLCAVSRNLGRLLRPAASLFLCMVGDRPALGTLWRLVHGNYKSASRSSARTAPKAAVKVYNPSRKQIVDSFAPEFTLRRWKGIGIVVPPSYMEEWASQYPAFTSRLNRIDQLISGFRAFRSWGICTLFEFERRGTQEIIP
jgi:2-polyprenyl-3-methyl-5-hydroxy-6-metoxy-1,4-benzoquinol methylase